MSKERPTTEDLLKNQQKLYQEEGERKIYLKKKDWFVIVYQDPNSEYKTNTIYRMSEMESFTDELEFGDISSWQGKVKFVQKTNKWFESLKERD